MLKCLVADSSLYFRAGVKALLIGASNNVVILEATTPVELIAILRSENLDMILLDLNLGGPTGESLIRKARAAAPRTPIIGMSSLDEIHLFARALKAGLKGFVWKNCSNDELVLAIHRVSEGRTHVGMHVAEQLALDLVWPIVKLPHEQLTERELDVFARLVKGNRIKQIAADLSLSVKTVSAHKIRLLKKMGFSTVAELVRYAMKQGILGFQSFANETEFSRETC